jgi:catechol 2,3-dioxygenase-like lactoylglutathione lyase family enzyme
VRVERIGYVGLRTDDVDRMTSFFRDVIGLEAAGEGETVTFQRLPTHRRDLLEVHAREHRDARLIPDDADVVIAFVVDDIREAMADVQAAGLELVGDPCAQRRRSATRHSASSPGSSYARPTVASSRSSRSPTSTGPARESSTSGG